MSLVGEVCQREWTWLQMAFPSVLRTPCGRFVVVSVMSTTSWQPAMTNKLYIK